MCYHRAFIGASSKVTSQNEQAAKVYFSGWTFFHTLRSSIDGAEKCHGCFKRLLGNTSLRAECFIAELPTTANEASGCGRVTVVSQQKTGCPKDTIIRFDLAA